MIYYTISPSSGQIEQHITACLSSFSITLNSIGQPGKRAIPEGFWENVFTAVQHARICNTKGIHLPEATSLRTCFVDSSCSHPLVRLLCC